MLDLINSVVLILPDSSEDNTISLLLPHAGQELCISLWILTSSPVRCKSFTTSPESCGPKVKLVTPAGSWETQFMSSQLFSWRSRAADFNSHCKSIITIGHGILCLALLLVEIPSSGTGGGLDRGALSSKLNICLNNNFSALNSQKPVRGIEAAVQQQRHFFCFI